MIYIILYYLLGGILRFIFKPKPNNILCCGIWAWVGKSPNSFNSGHFNTLGILNQIRGTDSCGMSVDGKIAIGIGKEKFFTDFLINENYDLPTKIPIVIGHTRNSTVGQSNVRNAHPFGFGKSKTLKNTVGFIGAHNGTLHNYRELATDYGIDEDKQGISSKNTRWSASKIDSEILLECLFKSEKFKVLSKYNGSAALIWYFVDQPNIVYCFHGATLKNKNGTERYIERPLFVYQEHRNSLYISSQDHGLLAIGAKEDDLIDLDTNVVYKIKDGNFKTAKKYPVSQAGQFTEREYEWPAEQVTTPLIANTEEELEKTYAYNKAAAQMSGTGGRRTKQLNLPFHLANADPNSLSNLFNIHLDRRQGKPTKKIYMEQFRYKRNGHPITGIYLWVTGYGFVYLGHSIKASEGAFYDKANARFSEGVFVTDQKKFTSLKDYIIPFPHTKESEIVNPTEHFHYFIKGIRLKNPLDYTHIQAMQKARKPFSIESLSNASFHPIIDTSKKSLNITKQGIFYGGVLADNDFCPLGSEKIYSIAKGNCIFTQLIDEETQSRVHDNMDLIKDKLEENEDELDSTSSSLQNIEKQILEAEELNLLEILEKSCEE